MQQPKEHSDVVNTSSLRRDSHFDAKVFAMLALVALMCMSVQLRAQEAATAPAEALGAVLAGQRPLPPEKSVQLQPRHQWTPRPDIAGANGARLYGADIMGPGPVFSVAEPNHRCSWLYNLSLPIDVAKYPIVVFRYRAKNIAPKSVYTLRVDSGVEKPAGVCRLFQGSEIVSDGQIHELKKDLREFNVTDPIALVGMGVESGPDGAATVEVFEIRFDAPDDAAANGLDEDTPLEVSVVDENDNPIQHARVSGDYERKNFSRTVMTNSSGNATVPLRKNDSETHMISVTAPGHTTVEILKITSEQNPIKVKLTPAKPYGGVAKVDGNPVAGAMVLATVKGESPEGQQELRTYSTITDEAGRWITPAMTSDVEQISLVLAHKQGDGNDIAKVDLDANEALAGANEVRRDLMMARAKAGRIVTQVSPEEGARIAAQMRGRALAAANANNAANGVNARGVAVAAAPVAQISPSQSIVIQLDRPWDPRPDMGGQDEAPIYGINQKLALSRDGLQKSLGFTSGQSGKSVVFTQPLALPIEIAKYPFVVIRYRAKNINPNEDYTFRADYGPGGRGHVIRTFAGSEIKSDGQEHELKYDMREANVAEPINQIGIALQASPDAAPATLEVLEIRFDTADEKANATGDDKPLQVAVTDADGQPIKDAIVSSDYERQNFARSASTDAKGAATVKTIKNESGKHSVAVQKKGFVSVEILEASADAPIAVKLSPGQRYGGVIKLDDKPVAGAMVQAVAKAQSEDGQRTITQFSTVTDAKGRWLTPELPNDASLVSLKKVVLADGAPAEESLDTEAAQTGGTEVAAALDRENGVIKVEQANGRILINGKVVETGGANAAAAPATMATDEAGPSAPSTNVVARVVPPGGVPANGQREFPLLPTPAAKAATGDQPLLAPEKAVVLDIHRPWLAGPMWDGNQPPKIYGENLDLPAPRFTVADANSKSFWVYKPAMPIELAKYPILKIKYRAKNTQTEGDGYVLRLVQGNVLPVLKSSELNADGQVHEFTKDLREMEGQRKLTNIGIWVNSGDKGNAAFDLVGLSFVAPDDAPVEKIPDVNAVTVIVTENDKPVAGAKVTLDSERLNWARSKNTDGEGRVTINLHEVEDDLHMARIEKDGLYPIERRFNANDNLNIDVQMVPGTRYGGIARGADNKLLPGAMVVATGTPELDAQTQMPARATVLSDSQGRWVTPILPAADGMSMAITAPTGESVDVDLARAKSDGPNLFAQLQKAMTVASANPPHTDSGAEPSAAKSEKSEKDKGAAPVARGPASIDATVLKVDETSVNGKITAMDGKQVTIKEGNKQIPLTDIQEITFKSSSGSNSSSNDSSRSGLAAAQLELASGDHFKGSIKKWEEKKLTVQLAAASSVTVEVPIDQARQLWIGPADLVKKAIALNEKPGVEDTAYVAKDDQVITVRGVSLGVEGDQLKFRFNDQERKIAVNRLVGITFGRSEDAPVDRQFRQTFQFNGDDTITGNWTGLTRDTIEATTIWGSPIKLPMKQIAKIRAANGRMVYLSDLKPSQVEQVPYFDRMLSYRVDKSLNGKSLQLTEGPVAKGIAVHSRTVLHYDLSGQFDEFRTKLGFQQPEGKTGIADVRVIGDGKVLFEKPDAKGDQPSTDVNVKVGGVKELVLEVDFGKNQDVGDRVVWGNARLLRGQLPQQTNASEGHTP